MTRKVFTFDSFRLDVGAYELRRSGRAVKLQRIPMELLILLAGRPGVLVTREEISSRLWPGEMVLGNEQNTNTAIRKLRQALRDNADHPRYIATVIGKGYRFVSEVCEEAPQPETAKDGEVPLFTPVYDIPEPAAAAIRTGRSRRVRTLLENKAALLVASACLAGAGAMVSGVWHPSPEIRVPRVVPLTALPGDESEPALSADGRRVAFVWTGPEKAGARIFVLNAESVQPIPLTSGAGRYSSPAWSPDDRQIAFVREQQGHSALYLIPSGGGTERRIADLTTGDSNKLSWSPDGKSIALREAESAEAIPGIFVVSVATGSEHRLTKPDVSGSGDWSPAYSPDGRSLIFQRNAGSARRTILYSASVRPDGSLRGPPSRIPLDVTDLTAYGSWSEGGQALILGRASGLFRISKAGGRAEPLPFADASEPAVSRDGRKLVFSQALRDTDIYRIQLQTGEVKKIIASTRRDDEAYLSADGRRVAFISQRSGADALWVADSDGSRAVPLVTFGGASIGTPHWSPDGEEIAFDSLLDGSSHIYVVRSSGGTARRITTGEWEDVRPSWSRQDKWIYFGSTRSGRWEIWKVKATGGEPVQVTRKGGREACEDPDGRFLYYTKVRPERGLWRIPVSGGEPEMVDHIARQGRWAVSRRGLYYLTPDDRLEFRDWTTGRLTTLRTGGLQLASHPAVAPDDEWLLIAAEAGIGRDLMEVADFR